MGLVAREMGTAAAWELQKGKSELETEVAEERQQASAVRPWDRIWQKSHRQTGQYLHKSVYNTPKTADLATHFLSESPPGSQSKLCESRHPVRPIE
jgi:hypothetical protein